MASILLEVGLRPTPSDRMRIAGLVENNGYAINNLKAWMEIQGVPLGILANFFPARLDLVVLRA